MPAPPEPKRQTPRKRKHEDHGGHGVSKRQQIAKTPSRGSSSLHPWEVDPYESPSVIRSLFAPSKKALGPTPKKDGQVLGLFDLLQEDGAVASPSIERKSTQVPVQSTSRKSGAGTLEPLKHSRTPASTGKRRMLDAFATPLKNRGLNGQGGRTPSSVSKLHFSTPSFLRRDSQKIQLPAVNEDEEGLELSPQMIRVPRKPLVRGLSAMLAGLRKMEEEAADDDLEALHEMEAEMAGDGTMPPPKPKPTAPKDDVLVEDSQPNFPLGGFDDEADFDSEPEESGPALTRDGQPLKVYKKKGQKRTTRRVNMKPTRPKPQILQEVLDSDDELQGEGETVPETQMDETAAFTDARNFDSDSQSEYTASEGGSRYKRPNQSKKDRSLNKDGRIKTAARKVNAIAHQNFKRLKLRNSGAKGGPAHNSRFRRKK